jgi:hypothetical protein
MAGWNADTAADPLGTGTVTLSSDRRGSDRSLPGLDRGHDRGGEFRRRRGSANVASTEAVAEGGLERGLKVTGGLRMAKMRKHHGPRRDLTHRVCQALTGNIRSRTVDRLEERR